MKNVEINEIPKFSFAHTYEADCYKNTYASIPGRIEISYISEGEMKIKKGKDIYFARTGDIVCLLHDEPISIIADKFHSHHTVCVMADWVFQDNCYGLSLPIVTKRCAETKAICDIIDEFIYHTYIYEKSSAKTAHKVLEALFNIDNINKKMNRDEYSHSILSEKAKNYIQKNINRAITQREVADFLGISPGYLCNVFKKSEGITLIKYINTVKLKSVQRIMEKEKLKLYEAAELYGYTDANYVSALYKELFGHNITEHKQEYHGVFDLE